MSTSIEWTQNPDGSKGKTWNPTRGCSRQSPGCDNCYAMRQAHRFNTISEQSPYHGLTTIRKGKVDWAGFARFIPGQLAAPLSWRKPQRVFVNSMSDLFHPSLSNEEIAAVFGVMAACPQHTFQVLTKQPKRAAAWFRQLSELAAGVPDGDGENRICLAMADRYTSRARHVVYQPWPLPNVWLGVSAEDQETYNERVPLLVHQCAAAVHFVSLEPMIGPIRLRGTGHIHLDWVIVGGESGSGARPFALEWAESLIAECKESGIACFVKQLGGRPYKVVEGEAWVNGTTVPWAKIVPGDDSRVMSGIGLRDKKGGDMSEWPEPLRIRQFPEARHAR